MNSTDIASQVPGTPENIMIVLGILFAVGLLGLIVFKLIEMVMS